jgi:hypothetical protein
LKRGHLLVPAVTTAISPSLTSDGPIEAKVVVTTLAELLELSVAHQRRPN